ncbi:hypothetical protein [Citrobacter portucalensis]|jgi:hypothetical protein|uniref:hypothetical protein n=1 Tax=Citrobacter portucalensis TaxID=1639133 RepID=UPI001ED9FFF6|nr:hypothetical protein [Citrobacter portucalensis]MCC2946062.1 hypothetical protein [Citrobacter freundii]UKK91365.1 hypothetical protein L6310_25195 [Citrobacter portucalensis]
MLKTHLLIILTVSAISTPTLAATDPLQGRVEEYCGKASTIILQAAAEYNHQLSNAVKPDEAKFIATQKVKDSDVYISASQSVKVKIDRAVNNSTDYVEYSRMMEEQDKIHERYVGVHAWTWAYHNAAPFTAWCNYNHIQG